MSVKLWNGSTFVDPSALKRWNGSAFVDVSAAYIWDGAGFVKVWPTLVLQDPVQVTVTATGWQAPPAWWRNGIDFYDIIAVGGGAAGKGDVFGVTGAGGNGGSYAVYTGSALTGNGQIHATLGAGGVGQVGGAIPANGGQTQIRDGASSGASTVLVLAQGGTGVNSNPGIGSGTYGKSPGNRSYQGMTMIGGAQVTGNGTNGNPPGGGGAGAGAFTAGGNGAPGRAMIQWRQNREVT